ncbi:MAG: aldo/keto reductase [Bifidobacteriaceae bacterium]|nr:aldo/keto reductase [Bifidobacteriaceae bacterium]
MIGPTLTLNDGLEIPQFGFGVFCIDGDNATQQATEEALAQGYRHIDTAHIYRNERGVGRAVKNSGIAREEVWITSKLWVNEFNADVAPRAIDEMLQRLDTDYLDLLLLHRPYGHYVEGYQAMEDAVRAGKIRSIGLSNFEGAKLQEIIDVAEIMPSINQIELHPYWLQSETKRMMEPYNIAVESWYPLGHGDRELLHLPMLEEIAQAHNKTVAQVILRWHIQHNHIIFPKSTNSEHIRENADIFDFVLSDDEMNKIDSLNKNKSYFDISDEEQEKQALSMIVEG